ncbi:MAG TPA: cytochrome P450 [Bacillus sp. (in: firmicutes)]|nr:cytochrome P450 [Bacillus sp. (in: firmicutes)]
MPKIVQARVITASKEDYQNYQTDVLGTLEHLAGKYGDDYDFVNIPFPNGASRYLILSAEYVEDVLHTKQKSFVKSEAFNFLKPLLGEGLLTSEGKKHKRDRRIIQPSFHMKSLSKYADTMVSNTSMLIKRWEEEESSERDISKDMMKLTLTIITETMFGTSIDQDKIEEVDKAFTSFSKLTSHAYRGITDIEDFKQQVSNSIQKLNDAVLPIIKKRRELGTQENDDLLAALFRAKDEESGAGMTDEEIYEQVMTFFLAGHETTSNALSWTWHLLSRNPNIEEKFHMEIDTVLGNRPPVLEDFHKLTYTKAVIQESMRLFPPAYQSGRQASEDVEMGGYGFKKGETFLTSQYVLHRSNRYFKEPLMFIPERFENGILKDVPKFAYFPFGGGSRVCIGNHFAMLEAVLVLAALGQQYKLQTIGKIEPEPIITLKPTCLNMKLIKRI